MRRWLSESALAARQVADRPVLWLPGALAWTVTVGWLSMLIGVARSPNVGELTFLGARTFSSGAWPWNALALGSGLLFAALVGLTLAAGAEAVLLHGRRASVRDAARILVIGVVWAVPTIVGLLVVVVAIAIVAPGEFNAPGVEVGPVARIGLRVAPLLVAVVVAASAGAALHAAATRYAVGGRPMGEALRRSPRLLAAGGLAAFIQAAAVLVARLAYLLVAAVLLRVLWTPIRERLEAFGMDAGVGALLVGFVAIWLCLVLGGGALHAWGSVSWTRVLRTPVADRERSTERMETSTGP